MTVSPPRRLLVADSFRVRANPRTGVAEVRGLDRHLDRFTAAALGCMPGLEAREAAGHRVLDEAIREMRTRGAYSESTVIGVRNPANDPLLARIEEFLAETRPAIADFGAGFPRLELWEPIAPGADPELALALRPLPELRDTIELRSAGRIPVDHPDRKGPNIARYAELNRELGVEALLLDEHGRVIEGATTSIIWWEDDGDESGRYVEEAFGGPSRRVESVTEALLAEAAQNRLVGTKPNRRRHGALSPARMTPARLAEYEVWAVNALHGIRPATSIDGVALRGPQPRRLGWFREALDRTWQPV